MLPGKLFYSDVKNKYRYFCFFFAKVDLIIVLAQSKSVFKELSIAKFKEVAVLLEMFYLPD